MAAPRGLTERRIDIGSLPPRELQALASRLRSDVDGLAERGRALQKVAAGFGAAGRAIDRLAEQQEGE